MLENYSKIKKSSIIKHFDPLGDIKNFKREVKIDNNLLEYFFSDKDSLYNFEDIEINIKNEEKIKEIFYVIENMLPEIERYVILLLFYYNKKQEVTGKILNVSQEMVCYYRKRALKRIKLLCFFRNIDIIKMELFLEKHVTKKQKTAMIEYFKDHDLRRITKKIGKIENNENLLYESVGSRIKLGIKKLLILKKSKKEEVSKEATLYHEVFCLLKKYNSLYHSQSKKKINNSFCS